MKITIELPDTIAKGYALATRFDPNGANPIESHVQTVIAAHVKNTAVNGLQSDARAKIQQQVEAEPPVVTVEAAVKP